MIFCLWLWTQAVYVINTLCLYCMIVWVVTIPAAILVLVRNVSHDLIKVTPRTKMIITTAAWPTIILFYVVIGASIVLRFAEATSSDSCERQESQQHGPPRADTPLCGFETSRIRDYASSGYGRQTRSLCAASCNHHGLCCRCGGLSWWAHRCRRLCFQVRRRCPAGPTRTR